MEGKIRNFTLQGNVFTVTARLDKLGETRYQLDISGRATDPLTYEDLVEMLDEIKSDVENVFELGWKFAEDEKTGRAMQDENGHLVIEGKTLYNDCIKDFEKTWNHADE